MIVKARNWNEMIHLKMTLITFQSIILTSCVKLRQFCFGFFGPGCFDVEISFIREFSTNFSLLGADVIVCLGNYVLAELNCHNRKQIWPCTHRHTNCLVVVFSTDGLWCSEWRRRHGGWVLAMVGSSEFLFLIAQKTHFFLILYRLKAHSIGSTAIYW